MNLESSCDTIYAYPNWDISGVEACNQALRGALGERGPTALYIHVPYCTSLCQFCGFTKSNKFNTTDLDLFTASILKEMDLVCDHFGIRGESIEAIYFGGGTPSVLSTHHVASILEHIHSMFEVHPDAEKAFEGECRTLSKTGFLEDLVALGFQRISYGVQTMHPGARLVLNLKPTLQDLAALAQRANQLFEDVTVDFIFGWQGQTIGAAVADITAMCLEIKPLSLEIFAFESGDASPNFLKAMDSLKAQAPTPEYLAEMRRALAETLGNLGYSQKTYTYFARPESRNGIHKNTYANCFYGYNNANVLGFGRGSQSFYRGHMWACGGSVENHHELVRAGTLPATVAGRYTDFEREAVIWPRRGWLSRRAVEKQATQGLSKKLRDLAWQGYISEREGTWTLTPKGQDRVPALIYYLVPNTQKALYDRDFQRNMTRTQKTGGVCV